MEEVALMEKGRVFKSKLVFYGVVAGIVVALALGSFVGYRIALWLNESTEMVAVDDVREELVPVVKLAAYEYNFTDVMHVSDGHKILGFEVPFTRNHYVATVNGTVLIGVKDAELIQCNLSENVQGGIDSVSVRLPHCEAWEATIDHESLEVFVDLTGIANEVSKEQLNDLYIEVEQEQEEKASTDGTLEKADARLRELLTERVRCLYGDQVAVTFEYIEDVEEEIPLVA